MTLRPMVRQAQWRGLRGLAGRGQGENDAALYLVPP
jgi:hypothetical protein